MYGYDQRVELLGSEGLLSAGNVLENTVVKASVAGVVGTKPKYFFLERYNRSFVLELETFFACIREDREPPVGGRDGLIPLLVGKAATRSMRTNRPVRVEAL